MSKNKHAQQVLSPVTQTSDAKPLVMVGLEQTPQGWVVVSATMRGDKVEATERHCPPQGKQWAARVLKSVLMRRVLFPNGR